MWREGCKLLHPAITLPGAIFSPLLLGPESSARWRGSVRPVRERVGIPPQSAAACECTGFGMSQMLQPPAPSSLKATGSFTWRESNGGSLEEDGFLTAGCFHSRANDRVRETKRDVPWCCSGSLMRMSVGMRVQQPC
ncbi:hypothetical protein MHYP_G00324640 [Metynnis hypsauchen]